MPGEIMLFGVNRKTKRSRKTARKARSHNRRRTGVKRRRKAATTVKVFAPNPKRRKRSRVMRFKRNPKRSRSGGMSMPGTGNIMNMVKVATIAASGGVLLDIGYGYLPIPDTLKTGPVSHLVKGAAAVGMALLAKRVVGAKMANELAFGALTVTLYGALRAAANTALPSLKLGLYDDLGLYLDGGLHTQSGHGPALNGMGYIGAGQVTGSSIMSAGAPMELQGEFRSF